MPFKLAHRIKAHARIIWGASWTHDSAYFATASRDGSTKLWHSSSLSENAKTVCTLPLQAPVMAVAFAPEQSQTALDASYTFAVGLETGVISVWSISCCAPSAQADAKCVWESPVAYRHCASVMRLCWQQAAGESVSDRECAQKPVMHLASCGDDQCVRIFSVCIEDTSSESN